jgi:uncharacterized membrane protein YdjX (TVP38/TMEM64 family)
MRQQLDETAIACAMQVTRRRGHLFFYILFLRVTPILPNTFINIASPIVHVPYHTFALATLIGMVPNSFLSVKVSLMKPRSYLLSMLWKFLKLLSLNQFC